MKKLGWLILLSIPVIGSAQMQTLTADDYARAEKFLSTTVNKLVLNGSIRATWNSDNTFWYKAQHADGDEYVQINAATGMRSEYSPAPEDTAGSNRPWWMRMRSLGVESPDGKKEAFIRDWNLWVRDKMTREETQLTTDGVENFGYATDNAGWKKSDRPILLWSPDSRKIVTQQQDDRNG